MQTIRSWYDHSSSQAVKADILEIRPYKAASGAEAAALILDKTIFYPEGGGQSADRGSIGGFPLLDVQEKDGGILHILSAGDAGHLAPGPTELILDWRRRRDFTVQHTAQHLLSGTILSLTGAYTVSMHLGEEINTIDVDTPDLSAETLLKAEDAVNNAIEEDSPVIIHLCPPEDVKSFPLRKTPPQSEEVIRVIEIKNNDFSPCCGTHCASTGQIGILRITGAEKYKGMMRVSFIAGRRCLAESRMLRENCETVSRSLKVPVAETGAGTLALLEKTKALEQRLKELEEGIAAIRADALLKQSGLGADDNAVIAAVYDVISMDEVLLIGRAAQKCTKAILVLASTKDRKFAALCSDKGLDVRLLVKDAFEKAGGKGGGGPSFFQGSFSSDEDLALFIKEVRANARSPV
jgi:alanyl-tRNA synthetase